MSSKPPSKPDLHVITEAAEALPPPAADKRAKREKKTWNKADRLKHDRYKAVTDSFAQDTILRRTYAKNATDMVVVWLLLVLTLLYFQGLGFAHLSDTVLTTLLVTTTANVIGLLLVVANYLFPVPYKRSKK